MKKLDEMKKEYREIKTPKELDMKVKDSIKKAKKEEKTKGLKKVTKWSGAVVTAAMVSIVILANSNQSIAHAMGEIPVLGSISKIVTFRTYTDKTNNFEANVEVPQIDLEMEVNTDKEETTISNAANEVNKSIEEYTDMLIKQYETDLKASEGLGNYAMDTSYEVITNNDNMLSIRINTVVAMGGSNSYSKIFHIDKQTDKVITLGDLFKEDSDYIGVISEAIINMMVEQMAADEMISYFYESEVPDWDFKEIKEEQNFYINDKEEIVIVFNKYEVAPGYMGMVEFVIPKDVTDIIMK